LCHSFVAADVDDDDKDEVDDEEDENDDDEEDEDEDDVGSVVVGCPSRKPPVRRAAKTGERLTRMALEAYTGSASSPARNLTSLSSGLSTRVANASFRLG
jgi:hypothetical protein